MCGRAMAHHAWQAAGGRGVGGGGTGARGRRGRGGWERRQGSHAPCSRVVCECAAAGSSVDAVHTAVDLGDEREETRREERRHGVCAKCIRRACGARGGRGSCDGVSSCDGCVRARAEVRQARDSTGSKARRGGTRRHRAAERSSSELLCGVCGLCGRWAQRAGARGRARRQGGRERARALRSCERRARRIYYGRDGCD